MEATIGILLVGFVIVASELWTISHAVYDLREDLGKIFALREDFKKIVAHLESIDDSLDWKGTVHQQLVDIEKAIRQH